MAVTVGTTQPARSSARRVKSFCLSDVSDVSAFTSGTSSSRESAMLCLRNQFFANVNLQNSICTQSAIRASPAAPLECCDTSVSPALAASPASPSCRVSQSPYA